MPLKKQLRDFLDEHRVKYVLMSHSRAYTAQELAATLHVPGKNFAKAVILNADGCYVMAVLPATHRVNLERFRDVCSAREVNLATEDEFAGLFPQCELGAMPPFGNLYDMPTYVDQTLAEAEDIYFNAASHSEVIRMAFADYQRLVQPVMGRFADHL